MTEKPGKPTILPLNLGSDQQIGSGSGNSPQPIPEEGPIDTEPYINEEIQRKFEEVFSEFMNMQKLDLVFLDSSKNRGNQFNYYERVSKAIFNDPELLAKHSEISIFYYYLTSVTDRELFSFLKAFFARYDPDRIFMLTFEQFSQMMESLARRFGSSVIDRYFLYLDKYNYHQSIQKDNLFSKMSKDRYFGAFTMQGIFERYKGDLPTQTDNSVKYLSDFWKFIPFVFNMHFRNSLNIIQEKREKYYLTLGMTQDNVPMKGNENSIYSILNSLTSIDGDLSRLVPFKQIEKAINVYRSINVVFP